MYQSPTCPCRHQYAEDLQARDVDVTVHKTEEYMAVKDDEDVPDDLRSSHTLLIDGYPVEGHIPLEAVARLLEERPDADGIALPGMPHGAPGMPGEKMGPFVIYACHADGHGWEYIQV